MIAPFENKPIFEGFLKVISKVLEDFPAPL
jgi:hypothetical protein